MPDDTTDPAALVRRHLRTAFALGVKAAEYVHGVHHQHDRARTAAILALLERVAGGDVTLPDPPDEVKAHLPGVHPVSVDSFGCG